MSVTTAPAPGTATAPRWRRPALRYISRWVVGPLATIVVAAFLIFVTLSFSPGDPVSVLLGSRATDAQREAMRSDLGLDQPVIVQFVRWIGGAVRGDFGASFTFRQDVWNIIGPRLGITLTLVAMAMILILIVGLGLGILGGVFVKVRSFISALAGVMISIPSFVAASFLIATFAVGFGLFPTFGAGSAGIDRIWHLMLPAVALSIAWGAYIAQLSITSISEERGKEHVTTAAGRGLPFGKVLRKHILRNAGIPILTASGLTLAALVAGSVIVESAFGIDGIGALLAKSVLTKDQPVVLAISVIIVAAFVVMTTFMDILQVVLDPQLREQKGKR